MRLSANFLRPERRSTDGQVILEAISDGSEEPSDLLLCGAPLRNRTVDLLLTMYRCAVPQPQVERLTCRTRAQTGTHKRQTSPHERHSPLNLPLTLILQPDPHVRGRPIFSSVTKRSPGGYAGEDTCQMPR